MIFFSDSQNQFFLTIIFGLFFVIGVILSRVLINYRLWHYRYVVAAQVIQILMIEGKDINKARINRLYKQVIETKYPTNHKKWIREKGTEDMILNIFVHVNFLSVIFFFGMVLKNNMSIMIGVIVGVYIIYIVSIKKMSKILLGRIKQAMREKSDNEVIYVWTLNIIENSSTVVYSNNYYEVKVDNSNIVSLEDKKDGVVIIPVTPLGEVILIKSKRPVIGKVSWEFPRGFKESKEISRDAAMRELKEEIGCESEDLSYIGTTYPNNGLMSTKVDVFIASNIDISNYKLQVEEGIEALKLVSYEKLKEMCQIGEIEDGFTLGATLLSEPILQQKIDVEIESVSRR